VIVLYIILALVVGLGIGWWLARLRWKPAEDPIRKHPSGMEESDPYRLCETIFTGAETAFFNALRPLIPQSCTLLAKIRFADLLTVTYGAGDRGLAHARAGSRSIDFLICDTAHRPQLAIILGEGDDPRSREFIQRVCDKIGLAMIRVPARQSYSAEEMGALLSRISAN
jgi:hypothetical protein